MHRVRIFWDICLHVVLSRSLFFLLPSLSIERLSATITKSVLFARCNVNALGWKKSNLAYFFISFHRKFICAFCLQLLSLYNKLILHLFECGRQIIFETQTDARGRLRKEYTPIIFRLYIVFGFLLFFFYLIASVSTKWHIINIFDQTLRHLIFTENGRSKSGSMNLRKGWTHQ